MTRPTPTPFAPIYMTDVDLLITIPDTLDGINFPDHVNKVEIVPNVEKPQPYKGLGKRSFAGTPTVSYALNLSGGQDWTDGRLSLTEVLRQHWGKKATIQLWLATGELPGWQVEAMLVPTAIGGPQGSYSPYDVSLDIIGEPIRLDYLPGQAPTPDPDPEPEPDAEPEPDTEPEPVA